MKIIFITKAVSLDPVSRLLRLAQGAKENGFEVLFAFSTKCLHKLQAISYGFASYRLYTIEVNAFYDRVNQGKFSIKLLKLFLLFFHPYFIKGLI